MENGRNFGRFPTNAVDGWKMAETVPKSLEKRHCWTIKAFYLKMAETTVSTCERCHFLTG